MKIFASDYDDTFFKHKDRPIGELEKNIAWVRKWQEAGNLFVFATGRNITTIGKQGRFVLPYDYVVGLNGGTIALPTGEILHSVTMDKNTALKILDIIMSKKVAGYSINYNTNFHFKAHMTSAHWQLNLIRLKRFFSKYRVSYEEITSGPISQISVFTHNNQAAQNFSKLISRNFGDMVAAYPNVHSVDICPIGASKATGIDYIAKIHDVPKENIYAMGDSYNDIPMLQAYTGLTVPKAVDDIKSHASRVHTSVSDAIKSLM